MVYPGSSPQTKTIIIPTALNPLPDVNKMLYGTIILLCHFFKMERAPLDEQGLKEVFPDYRAADVHLATA